MRERACTRPSESDRHGRVEDLTSRLKMYSTPSSEVHVRAGSLLRWTPFMMAGRCPLLTHFSHSS